MNHLIDNFIKTNAILSTAVMTAQGWDVKVANKELLVQNLTYVYVLDQKTNYVWMASIATEDFVQFSQAAADEILMSRQDTIDTANVIIHQAINGIAQNKYKDWEALMAYCLASYSGTTRTWELASKMQQGGHFCIIRYSDGKSENSTLRPFFVGANEKNLALEVPDLLEMFSNVYASDKKNHPEYFK